MLEVLLDDKESSGHQAPTRANMLEAMDWLVAEAQAGDALLLHYSGHGGREPAEGEHGYHETLVPLDFETAGAEDDWRCPEVSNSGNYITEEHTLGQMATANDWQTVFNRFCLLLLS